MTERGSALMDLTDGVRPLPGTDSPSRITMFV